MNSPGTLAGGLVMMVAVMATAAGIARYSKFYRHEMSETGKREIALDGLRGMAALMVATHHAALSLAWFQTGDWGDARSAVFQVFGPGGVMLFFMLTGYLFWGKARAMNGKMKAGKLWRGRLYRIAPLYLFSLLLVVLVAAIQTGGHWLALENWRPLLRLLALGALKWHDIGPVSLGDYNAGVVWTLWYEWIFYLILPFIAWFAPGRRIFGLALIFYALALIGIHHDLNLQFGVIFMWGMLCPMFLEDSPVRSQLRRPRAAVVALGLSLAVCLLCRSNLSTRAPFFSLAGVLAPLFLAAAAGNSFFGWLTRPAIRCLGAMSFSLYLLHGIIFLLVFRLLKGAGWTDLPQLDYWLIIILTAVATTFLCAATYRWIEFPFIAGRHKKSTTPAPDLRG